MKVNESMFNAFLANKTPLWMAHHDHEKLEVEMPISGDALRITEENRKNK